MLAALHRPLPIDRLAAAMLGAIAAVAGYCLVYSALSGRSETLGEALGWALVNVLPWMAGFEAAKRSRTIRGRCLALAAALAASLLLGLATAGGGDLPFEAIRRLPALLIVAGLLAIGRRAAPAAAADRPAPVELPLPPDRIDWVAAAGNYVEINGCGRTLVSRASLAAVEHMLRPHGFVRIHRSRLVRRDRIARVRPADVILLDGTSLKTGKRYRAALHG